MTMKSLKRMVKAWLLMNVTFALLVMATQPALASDSLDLDSIINALPAGWGSVVAGVFIVLYAVAQLRAVLPPSVTNKIPTVVMKILDFVAANYAHARNADAVSKAAKEAAKAEGPSDDEYRVMVETAKNKGELRGSRIESAGDYPGDDRPGSKSTK
ncbi:TPA: TrbC/VirB2 family protein [Citrobacter freundii]|nr:TrbC/VirB2 family protein [Citrobacter freundii]EKU1809516.1 TrbC/VirB2 family protein [Citrobacter freundii]EKW3169717.1 TrbC/VirB2 family protein [Citrobacter freundii]EKX8167411.1 TrbC/VirB2 family protein [Citrobacter freundii]EKZ2245805.1 TrbC/VirB2 family protein [Citrobacter freundii]